MKPISLGLESKPKWISNRAHRYYYFRGKRFNTLCWNLERSKEIIPIHKARSIYIKILFCKNIFVDFYGFYRDFFHQKYINNSDSYTISKHVEIIWWVIMLPCSTFQTSQLRLSHHIPSQFTPIPIQSPPPPFTPIPIQSPPPIHTHPDSVPPPIQTPHDSDPPIQTPPDSDPRTQTLPTKTSSNSDPPHSDFPNLDPQTQTLAIQSPIDSELFRNVHSHSKYTIW